MKKLFLKKRSAVIFLWLPFLAFAQENRVTDSLRQIISRIPPGDNIRKAKELITLGQQYVFSSNYPAATDCYEQSLAIAQYLNNDSLQGGCYVGLAAVAYYEHDTAKDSIYHFKALEFITKAKDTLREGKLLKNIAASFANKGNLQQATKYYEQALIIFKKLDQPKLAAGAYSNMAAMYRWNLRSIELELAAKKIWEKYPNDGVLPAANIGNLGSHYFYVVKFDSLKSLKHDSIIPASAAENLQRSELYLRQAIEMATQNNDINNQSHFMGELADLQEYKADYKNAYLNMKRFYEIQDSLFSQENKNKIAALEGQRAIDLKNKEIENKELQIGNQRKGMWLLISAIAFLFTTGAVIYRQSILRKKTNTTLRKLNYELDDANKIKAKFFGIISHDLRSPVANLINFLQLQKRKPDLMDKTQIANREEKIGSAAKSLLETMDAMLLWSKGQMEHFKPSLSVIEVNSLFIYIEKFFTGTENIIFTFRCDKNFTVNTDENYLKAIMHNLTANAVKAIVQTPGAQIIWKAWQENNKTFLSVTDNGAGASNEQLKALYDETASSGALHGLGLHIIRDLAKAIGCTVTLEPQTKTGTTFILSL
jgi:signal transduction histidine kinase